ncbi:MAG: hypothetical protein K9I85_03345 [Saprospiraceae bacterium]|nr:hypothetical protein [Saprospiraceae bacterium]
MGFIKNLKSLFIEENSTDPQVEPENMEPTAPADTPSKPVNVPRESTLSTPKGKLDQRFLDTLLNAMEEQNLEGFDYLEFRQALKSLGRMNMDEATRFKSAFAMAQTMNVTPSELTRTATVYLDILNKEQKKFSEALANQEKTQINVRQERLSWLDETILKHQQEIESLMASINTHRKEAEQLKAELDEVHQKMVVTQDQFTRTHTFLVEEINSDISKMEQYLK